MHWWRKPWADERLDEVAADTQRQQPSRLVSAVVVFLAIGRAVEWPWAAGWLVALIAAEGLARLSTRRFVTGRVATPGDRLAFVLGAIPINVVWAFLAARLWMSPHDLKIAAVGVWAGQLIFAQNYRHQPWVLMLVSSFAPLVSLVIFPFFLYDARGLGPDTIRIGLVIVGLSTINVMLLNRAAARRMDDLTQGLREERERALEATRAKSTFIAVTSHELRTPMNGLLGMAHALSRSNLDAAQREQVRLMIKSGDNLMQLLNDVLDLSRIEAGKVELAREAFSPRETVGEVIDAWRDVAVFKNLELTARFADDTPDWVEGDALRVRQVLTNLISNALKFVTEGGVHVEVSAGPAEAGSADREIRMAVRDTGPGVPPQAASRVFESFTQADGDVSRQHGGAGLGLTISRSLARQMGGDLVLVPSTEGACFAFSIRAPETHAPAPAVAPVEPDTDFDAVRVLMAEDNPINQLVVQAMLEATGIVLTTVENGQAALEAMRGGAFDCVLMDINMPVMDGITALQAIRAGAAGDAEIPIIALTASTMAGDRERFLRMGFDDHLGKPVKPVDLITAIARAIGPDEPGSDALNAA